MKLLAKNKRATYDYELSQKLVAGLELLGPEVKSIKAAQVSLKGSFITFKSGEAYLTNAQVTPYKHAQDNPDPLRPRKLLLHKRELEQLFGAQQSGNVIIPTAILLERNLVKVEIAVGSSKKKYDKRESIKKRDTDREVARQVRSR